MEVSWAPFGHPNNVEERDAWGPGTKVGEGPAHRGKAGTKTVGNGGGGQL